MEKGIGVREQSPFYFGFETLAHGRKESKFYALTISGNVCGSIIYHAEYNRVFCSDVAEYMIRDVFCGNYEPDIIPIGDDELYVYFNFSLELASMLEVYSITSSIAEGDLIRSCLIFWEKRLRKNYDRI